MSKDIILVTGGAGYIGSIVTRELVKKGEKVRVFDKLYFGKDSLREVEDKIEIIQGDVREFKSETLDDVKAVIHLGSLSNDPTAEFDPKANHEINCVGTMNVAEAAKKKGIRVFTFASSCAIYGFHLEGIADEEFSVNPQSEYAQSKLDAEKGLLSISSDSFKPIIFRQATVIGFSPRMRWDLVVNTMTKDAFSKDRIYIYSSGEMWRPLVHVRDVADAHIAAVLSKNEKAGGQIFNLVHKNYQILELGHRIREILKPVRKVDVEVLFGTKESRSYRVSGKKLMDMLGIEPKRGIEEAVKEIWDILSSGNYTDFHNPIYYNIDWMKLLVDMETRLSKIGRVF